MAALGLAVGASGGSTGRPARLGRCAHGAAAEGCQRRDIGATTTVDGGGSPGGSAAHKRRAGGSGKAASPADGRARGSRHSPFIDGTRKRGRRGGCAALVLRRCPIKGRAEHAAQQSRHAGKQGGMVVQEERTGTPGRGEQIEANRVMIEVTMEGNGSKTEC